MISVGANVFIWAEVGGWRVGILKLHWALSASHSHIARSSGACIRCWRPRFLRITLPCNYLEIMREPPTLSLHNHNPQPLRPNLDLPSLLLFWLTPLCLFLPLSLISSVYLSVSLHSICPGCAEVFEWFSTVKRRRGTAEHTKWSALSLLLCAVVRPNCQLVSLNNVVVYPRRVNNSSISSICRLISVRLKQPTLLGAGANRILRL